MGGSQWVEIKVKMEASKEASTANAPNFGQGLSGVWVRGGGRQNELEGTRPELVSL